MTDRFTEYGFTFGAAEVTRVTHIDEHYHVLSVKTKYRSIEVYISPKGRALRVFEDGKELKPEAASK